MKTLEKNSEIIQVSENIAPMHASCQEYQDVIQLLKNKTKLVQKCGYYSMKEVVEILKPIKIEASLTSNTNININLNINAKK